MHPVVDDQITSLPSQYALHTVAVESPNGSSMNVLIASANEKKLQPLQSC